MLALRPLGSGGPARTGDSSLDDLLGVGDGVDVLNVLVSVHVLDGLALVEVLGHCVGDPGSKLGFEGRGVEDGLGLGQRSVLVLKTFFKMLVPVFLTCPELEGTLKVNIFRNLVPIFYHVIN